MTCSNCFSNVPPIDTNERVNKDYEKLINPWKLPGAKKFIFKNVSVIDTVNEAVISNVDVVTENGVIAEVLTTGTATSLSQDYLMVDDDLHRQPTSSTVNSDDCTVVDCSGKFLCPGLFDAHVHITSVQGEPDLTKLNTMPKDIALLRIGHNAEAMLSRGFTTVRDCAGAGFYVKDAIDKGIIHGPRLFRAGNAISQTGGHGDFRPADLPGQAYESCLCHLNLLGTVVDGVPDCLKATREQLRMGADFIKIMGSGGVASPTDKLTNTQFIEEEIQSIVKVAESYGTFVTAHAYSPAAMKHCILNGVKGIEHGNFLDDETAKLMVSKNCYLTPTLITYKIMASDQFKSFLTEGSREKNYQVLEAGLQSLLTAKKNGVKICYGSDLLGSLVGYQTGEFFLRAKVLNPGEILKSATVTPAEMMGWGDKIGQIKQGYIADMILLDSNPLVDVTVLDEPEKYLLFVMKDGLIFKSFWDNLRPDV
ncbi:hypothetical protein PACTADRAFT_85076 [Pachysolen tannophilus NRRL Y-2460]|uniref:Amidohydrolase-related domain-containing protein n=1 Tax=Pachysolen tannophilus NRRL Y-2460 TaxID=669874 RepID=A0A1E4TX22_PACTA|nr:hypothetical protein PACTADRAFT_85076 [Pachysolen tannophilus NRRL Y-2460]